MTWSTALRRAGSSPGGGTSYRRCDDRIRALARTMRWATVGPPVRKARAISSVVRPHTSRSAIATCASGGSAGWQQMNSSRSRSSWMSSSSVLPRASSWSSSRAASSPSAASNRARRRRRSIGLEATRGHQPRPRAGGNTVAWPALRRRGEGVLERLLGELEFAQQADERGQDPTRLLPIQGVDRRADVPGHVLGHDAERSRTRASTSKMGRTSMLP